MAARKESQRLTVTAEETGRVRTAREARGHVIAVAQVEAERHQPDDRRGGCTCGFCVWSVDHVLVMSMRQALDGVGFVMTTSSTRTRP